MGKLNYTGYTELIKADIEALNKAMSEYSLERRHIVEVLNWSIEALYGEKTDVDILKEKLSIEQRQNEMLVYECNNLKQQLETLVVNANSLYPDNKFIEWASDNYSWFNGIWTSKWTDTHNPPEQKTTQQLIGLYINLPKTTNLT
jgi:hypothetical protein